MTPPIVTESAVLEHAAPAVQAELRRETRRSPVRTPRHAACVLNAAAPLRVLLDGAPDGLEFLTLHADAAVEQLTTFLRNDAPAYCDRGIRFQALTNTTPLSAAHHAALEAVARLPETRNARLTVTLAVGYDTKRDIAQAAAICARKGALPTADEFLRHMAARNLPAIDLVLHAGGSRCLSSFLLWHAAYAELAFVRAPWAEFRAAEWWTVLADYAGRTRTFGAVPAR